MENNNKIFRTEFKEFKGYHKELNQFNHHDYCLNYIASLNPLYNSFNGYFVEGRLLWKSTNYCGHRFCY